MQLMNITPLIFTFTLVTASIQFYNPPKFLTMPELLLSLDVYVVPQDGIQDPNIASLSLADASGKQILLQDDGTKAFTPDYPLKYTAPGAASVYKYKYARANWTNIVPAGEYVLKFAYSQTKLSDGSAIPIVQSTSLTIVEPAVTSTDSSEPAVVTRSMDGTEITPTDSASNGDSSAASSPKSSSTKGKGKSGYSDDDADITSSDDGSTYGSTKSSGIQACMTSALIIGIIAMVIA